MNIKGRLEGIHYIFLNNKKKNTLILLHGFTGNSSIWNEQIELLGTKYNFLLIDLLGHGESETPKKIEEYKFYNQSEIILRIIKKLRINSFSLICYSFSICIGFEIAKKVPDKIKTFIFISPFVRNNNFLDNKFSTIIKFLWIYLVPNKKHDLNYLKIKNYEKPTFKDKKYVLKSINTKDFLGSIYAILNFKNVSMKFDFPLLVIYGEKDKASKQIKNFFKCAKFKIIKEKEHLFLKTKSKQVGKEIIIFLNSLK